MAKDKQSVINIVGGSEETASERLVKKHLPAWVVSGGLHVVLALTALLITKFLFPHEDKPIPPEAVMQAEEKGDEPSTEDLTRETEGIDSNTVTAIDTTTREEDITVENKVTTMDPVGNPT